MQGRIVKSILVVIHPTCQHSKDQLFVRDTTSCCGSRYLRRPHQRIQTQWNISYTSGHPEYHTVVKEGVSSETCCSTPGQESNANERIQLSPHRANQILISQNGDEGTSMKKRAPRLGRNSAIIPQPRVPPFSWEQSCYTMSSIVVMEWTE